MKILCGDNSDSIKGIKRLGEDTLLKHFPQLKKRKVTLYEILEKSKILQQERVNNKKKPLQIFDNIVNSVTDGIQGKNIYQINTKLIDLTKPLLTEDSIKEMYHLMNSNLSDDRSIKAVYGMLKKDGIDTLLGEHRYNNYLLPFKKLIQREKNTIL